jgi:hypothetical protein
MEWDITDYWSNLWEQTRSAWARFMAIPLLVQNFPAISGSRPARRENGE